MIFLDANLILRYLTNDAADRGEVQLDIPEAIIARVIPLKVQVVRFGANPTGFRCCHGNPIHDWINWLKCLV